VTFWCWPGLGSARPACTVGAAPAQSRGGQTDGAGMGTEYAGKGPRGWSDSAWSTHTALTRRNPMPAPVSVMASDGHCATAPELAAEIIDCHTMVADLP
jgi:hypothetical protein